MADIDQLSIQIETSATGADKNLASLAKGLDKLQSALNKIDVSTFSSKMQSIAGSVNTLSTSINSINPKNLENLATVVNKVGSHIDTVAKKAQKLNTAVDATKATDSMSKLADGAKKASDAVDDAKMDDKMENADAIRQTADAFRKMSTEAQKTSNVISDVFDGFAKVYAFGGAVGKLADGLDSIANKANNVLVSLYKFDPEEGIKDFLKLPTKILPMLGVVEDKVKSKLSGVKEAFSDMGKTAMGVFNKMENFFAKIGQRFTFTLLRKAINAVIKDLNDAMVSLANFSGTTGREFNSAMSSMAASAKWLGASIVGAFAPLVSAISPYIDALISKLVEAIRVIGMFFAALTGKGTIAVANKGMTKFGASTEKAAKSAKKLESYLLGIDELNVFQKNDNDSGGGAGGGSPYNWEEVDIPDWLKNLADKFRDILEKLLAPIKEAWDRTKNYVISGFKYMIGELGRLLKSIGRDFLEMWNEEATIRMLENIFRIFGDIEYTIGNLAKRFREAWDEGRVGLHIFEHIRDIFATLIQHVRNVTKYMRDWSDTLNFRPLLHTFDELLVSLNKVADFIGGVFEDVMKNIVFKYIKWLIEEGIPHLNHTIKTVIDAFDFSKIREDLVPLENAIETLMETLETGFIDAVGNVGKALAEWTNSQEFTDFLEDIAGILNRITPERVEKFFSALGYAILDIVKAIAKFVHSNAFQNFLDKLLEWFDKASAKDMAKVINGIAGAIAAFKFVAFVGTGFKNFLQFIAIAKVAGLGNLTNHFSTLTGVVKAFGSGIKEVGTQLASGEKAFDSFGYGAIRLKDGLSAVSHNMSGFEKAMTTVVAGAAEFLLVSDAFETITKNAQGMEVSFEEMSGAVVKAIAGITAAWMAFSLVFDSTVIGAILAGVVAVVAAIKGIGDALNEMDIARVGQTIHDALMTPGGVSIDEYFSKYTQLFNGITEETERTIEKLNQIGDTRTSIEDTSYSIYKIKEAIDAGAYAAEEKVPEMIEQFHKLLDDSKAVFDEEYELIVGNVVGAFADSIEAMGGSVPEVVSQLLDFKNQATDAYAAVEEKLANLETAYKDGRISADEYYRQAAPLMEKLNTYNYGNIDETANSITRLGNSLDFSKYLDESNTLDANKFIEDYKVVGDAAYEALNSVDEASAKSKDAISNWNSQLQNLGIETSNFDWAMLFGADEGTKNKNKLAIEQAYGETGNELQNKLLNEIPKIFEQARENWKNETPLITTAFTSEEAYVEDAVSQYIQNVITPAESAIKDEYERVGVDMSTYATDTANEITNALFTYDGAFGAVNYAENAKADYKSICDGLIQDAEGYGKDIVDGLGRGINDNTGLMETPANNLFSTTDILFHNNTAMPFGSPNKKTIEYGHDLVEGLNKGIEEFDQATTQTTIQTWMTNISTAIQTFIPTIIEEVFTYLQETLVERLTLMSETMFNEVFLPLFGVDYWQPLFDTLMEEVFQVNFDNFRSWFTDEAMTPWWEEDLLPWFEVEKWNTEIIEPVDETIRTHIEDFIKFWQDKVKKWFQNDVEPWFKKERWNTYGLNMKEGIYGGFKGIVQSVGGVINGLIDVFNNGIENIVNAVNSLIDSFNTLAGALGLPSIGSLTAPKIPRITIPSFYNGGFTPYGNPSSYSLFAAGENGVAEMVGQVGGRPAVASNEEITGIRDAVNESGYRQEELLGQIINIATALLNKDPILIGDRQIAEANRRGESLLGMAIIS